MSTKQNVKSRTFKLTATTDSILVVASNPNRKSLFIQNTGSYTVYLTSAQNLPYTEGVPIEAGSWLDEDSTSELYLITASSSSIVICKEDCYQ